MYTYGELTDDVKFLTRKGVKCGSIGKSAFGREIYYVRIDGTERKGAVITAGIHAREDVSTLFAIKQIYAITKSGSPCDLWFVPMVNPDGNVLAHGGAGEFPNREFLLGLNGGSEDFGLWKANGRGVDLNVNFDAKWGEGAKNVRSPAPENYVGTRPFSEPESAALAAFTARVNPLFTLSYHAKGREIYYDFGQTGNDMLRDRAMAEYAASVTGYSLIEGTRGSAGGYKDWCVAKLGIPALTLELVSDEYSHPLPNESIKEDFEKGWDLPIRLYEFPNGGVYERT